VYYLNIIVLLRYVAKTIQNKLE